MKNSASCSWLERKLNRRLDSVFFFFFFFNLFLAQGRKGSILETIITEERFLKVLLLRHL